MFETAELGRKVKKDEYKRREPALRQRLLTIQGRLREMPFPVIILFGGVDGAGKGETVNVLNEWMDPRWMVTRALGRPTAEESERPRFWRFWRDQPPKGHIGIFLSAWYHEPLLDRVYGETSLEQFDEQLDEIIAFEKTLADDGALILKFWMHLGKKAQEKRFRSLQKDPLNKDRVTETDWKHWSMYNTFVQAGERIIRRTSTGTAPWHIVEGADANYRSLYVGETLFDALERHLDEHELRERARKEPEVLEQGPSVANAPLSETAAERPSDKAGGSPKEGDDTATGEGDRAQAAPRPNTLTVLDTLDMDAKLAKQEYRERRRELQARIRVLHRKAHAKKLSSVLIFEGWDAGGKGGAIRRVTKAFDIRSVRVIQVAAPTDEEREQHYLWRFWRHMSRVGRMVIFDRSWYGRVLVERVEGLATEAEWRRAYAEINDFEEQLVRHGIVLVKLWLHITPEEQLRRFKEREQIPYKRWKLTDEDWRNRERWHEYEVAVHDMVERTSTRVAPWHLIPANDKPYARVEVLQCVADALANALE